MNKMCLSIWPQHKSAQQEATQEKTQNVKAEESGNLIPFFEGRALKQTLHPATPPALERTLCGRLLNVQKSPMKYATKITGHDQSPFALEGLVARMQKESTFWVHCIVPLKVPLKSAQTEVHLSRKAVRHSVFIEAPQENGIHIRDEEYQTNIGPVEAQDEEGKVFALHDTRLPEGCYLTYLPKLLMHLKDYSIETRENTDAHFWCLELEEV